MAWFLTYPVQKGGILMAEPSWDAFPVASQPPAQPISGYIPAAPKQPTQLQLDEAARAAAEEERKRKKFEQEEADRIASGGVDASVEQGKAASFYNRASKANAELDRLIGKYKLDPDSLIGHAADAVAPGITSKFASDERNAARSVVRDFISATLRYESGANIPTSEFLNQYQIYFPSPDAGPEEIATKARARQTAIEGLKIGAGPAAARVGEGQGPTTVLPQDEFNAAVADKIKRGEGLGAIIAFMTEQQRPPTPEQIDKIAANIGNKNPRVETEQGQGIDAARALGLGVGDIAQAAGNTLGIVANPLNAGINAVFGTNLGTDLGQSFRDAIGAPNPENNTELMASAINKTGASALGLAGLARAGAGYATGATQNALARFGSAPLTDTVAGAGSGAGGEYARQEGYGPVGQIAASTLAGGLTVPVSSYVTRRAAGQPAMNDLMQAGQAEGVNVNRAMVDKSVQPRVTGTQATMVGGRKINREMDTISGQIEAGVQRLGQGGQPLEPAPAGQAIQRSAERYIKKSGKQARKAYDQAEAAAGDVKIQPQEAGQEIGSIITRLSETANTNSAEIAYLKGLEQDLGKGLSVGALRDLRTTLRQKISKGELTFGQNEARVLGIMDAISRDLETGLRSQGKDAAARLFAQADKDYRARMEFINGTVQKVIGKRNSNLSPERVFANFENMAKPKGDEAGLARMMRTMEPDEQADMAATFAEALGKNGKGEFSTAFLATQAEKLPTAAKVNLFGQEGAASLDRLVKLAKEHSRVTGSFNNSRTGQANDYRSWIVNLVLGGGPAVAGSLVSGGGLSGTAIAGASGAAAVTGLKAARDALSARALMSTDLTKWLASAPATTSPKAINSHLDRLSAIAARQPALQADIKQLQQRIMEAANDLTGKAAASGPGAGQQEADSRKAPAQE